MAAGVRQGPDRGREPGQDGARERPGCQTPPSAQGLYRLFRAARSNKHVPGLPDPAWHPVLHPGLPSLAKYNLRCETREASS